MIWQRETHPIIGDPFYADPYKRGKINTVHPPAPGSQLASAQGHTNGSMARAYGSGRTASTTYTSHDGRSCSTANYPYYREPQGPVSSNPNEKDMGREGASDLSHGMNILGSLLDGIFNTTRPRRATDEAYLSNPNVNARYTLWLS